MLRPAVQWLTVVLLTFLLSPAGFTAATDYDHDIAAARKIFLQAVDSGSREVRKATQHFRAMRGRYPDNPVVQAYLAACTSLQAREADSGVNKQRFSEEAIKEIDATLARLTDDTAPPLVLETRLVAAHTLIHMPPFLNRFNAGASLVEDLQADTRVQDMPAPFRASVHLAAAKVAKRRSEDDAYRHHLNTAMELDPDGRNGRRAAELLKAAGQ